MRNLNRRIEKLEATKSVSDDRNQRLIQLIDATIEEAVARSEAEGYQPSDAEIEAVMAEVRDLIRR